MAADHMRRLSMAEWSTAVFGTSPILAAYMARDAGAPAEEQVIRFEAALPKFDLWGVPAKGEA
jgi:hypothetical protein